MEAKKKQQTQMDADNMIRRLHRLRRFRCQVDRDQRVRSVCATGALQIGERLHLTRRRNLPNLSNLRMINSLSVRWTRVDFSACRDTALAGSVEADPFVINYLRPSATPVAPERSGGGLIFG
jgi:hypothetical protein